MSNAKASDSSTHSIGTSPAPPSQHSVADNRPALDDNPPTTTTVPTASPSTTDTKTLNQKQSFIRHTPSSYNTFAYQPHVGKDLASLLVDESGMAPRFHLLDAKLFLDSIDATAPTEDDYNKFKEPDLTSKKKEHELYPELAAVVQSVLDAAGCNMLRFLNTANHKAKDGHAGKKDTFNDGGIYVDSPLAREATEFTDEHRAKSQMSPEDLARRLLGLRSWHWLDILFELKMSEDLAAFYFKTKPRGRGYKKMFEALAAQSAAGTPQSSVAMDPSSEGETGPEGETGIVEGEDKEGEPSTASAAREGSSIPDATAVDDPTSGDHADKETEALPGITTQEVPPFIKLSGKGRDALGQFVEYMLNVQKNQHRVFSYAVYICYDMARLFRFDRSGVFVSEPFLWTAKDSLLHQFVWKIAKLANSGQLDALGHDTTATLASGEAKDKFLALKDDASLPPHVREGFKMATADKWPIYKLEVASEEPSEDEWFEDMTFPPPKNFSAPPVPSPPQCAPSSKPSSSSDPPQSPSSDSPLSVRHFLVGRPHFAADGLVGRCTRGYFAYDVTDLDSKNWRVCFLKDSWRPVVPGRTRPEHLVYQRLRLSNVNRGIATLICGGDVGGHWAQRTHVQNYLPEDNRPVLRVHYRLVIEEIGIRLEDFKHFSELSAIFVDVLIAHHKCWTLGRVLHRDISVGNIMILPSPDGARRRGFLIDWDLSRLEGELGTGPVEPDRTGTWQFCSALSLLYPWKPYRRSDDIESFIHVYLYLVLRFHPSSVHSLKNLVTSLFEDVSLVRGIATGGERKLDLFLLAKLPFKPSANPSLQQLVQDIIAGCSQSYGNIDLDEMERRYGFPELLSGSQHPQAPAEVPHAASDDVDDYDDLDGLDSEDDIPKAPGPGSPSIEAAPTERKDPCVVEGFLSEVTPLVKLFKTHAGTRLLWSDKACDQFPARQYQDVRRGPDHAGSRGVGSASTSGTFLSRSHSSNASRTLLSNHAPRPRLNAPPVPSPASGTSSLDSTGRKRMRAEDLVEEAVVRDGGEPSDSVPRNKRVK